MTRLRGLSLTKSNGESLLHVVYRNYLHAEPYTLYIQVRRKYSMHYRLRFDVHLIANYICLDIAFFSIIWSGVQSQSVTFAISKFVFNSFIPSLIAFLSLQIYVGKPHSLPPPALSFAFVQAFLRLLNELGLFAIQVRFIFLGGI